MKFTQPRQTPGSNSRNPKWEEGCSGLVGHSAQFQSVLDLARKVAPQKTTVMLLGESGTGKELLARAIHEQSPRAAHPFVAINCSAFPESLIESELFGFEKGAFTGAERPKLGKIQKAEGGTLFLDEVTELSPSAQSKILRVLQERQFEPLGSLKTVPVDIRILAATNQDLEARVREGKFRDDLFYRLFVFPIYLPSIRDRKEDLDELIDFFTDKFCREMKKESRTFSPEARKVLRDYPWPGNIRELQNVLERVLVLSSDKEIKMSDLPAYLFDYPLGKTGWGENFKVPFSETSFEEYIRRFEAGLIIFAMKKSGFNQMQASRYLGLPLSTFRYKLLWVRKEYKKYFCEEFLTSVCKPCQETLRAGKECSPLMKNFFVLSLSGGKADSGGLKPKP